MQTEEPKVEKNLLPNLHMSVATLKTKEFQGAAKQNDAELFAKYFVLRLSRNKMDKVFTYGIVISRKVAPSCIRNKIKRRFRSIIADYAKNNIAPYTVIIYARKSILRSSYQELEQCFHLQINKFKNLYQ